MYAYKSAVSSARSCYEALNSEQRLLVYGTKTLSLLEKAIELLEDKLPLQNLYNSHKDKQKGNYTEESWADFQAALSDAKDALDSPTAEQSDVDTALNNLQTAVDRLEEVFAPSGTTDTSDNSSAESAGLSSEESDRMSGPSSGQPPKTGEATLVIQAILLVALPTCGMLAARRKRKQ